MGTVDNTSSYMNGNNFPPKAQSRVGLFDLANEFNFRVYFLVRNYIKIYILEHKIKLT